VTVTPHNIAGRPDPPPGFCHATVAQGSRIVHIGGQVGTDEHGAVVPGGLAAQAERALLNLGLALDETGATFQDLASMRLYVVNWDPSMFEDLGRGATAAGAQLPAPGTPAVTLIGVSSLFTPDMLIEIEAVAILD
jgi:enamine deaminase RidA (YjgF/YER057c/UK114 family)